MAALAPGLAACQAVECQNRACCGTVLLKRLQTVPGTTRLKSAGVAKPRAEKKAIRLNQRYQKALRKLSNRLVQRLHECDFWLGTALQAICINTCSSVRTACLSAAEDALKNNWREKSRRSRIR